MADPVSLFPDAPPPTEEDAIRCMAPGCTVELAYVGKGRKPTKCDEHKRLRGGAKQRPAPASTGNAKLAEQAADVLCQLNEMACLGLMVAKLHGTAGAISERNEVFREQAYEALLTDPGLCRTILRAGATSGKVALLVAYGMLAASVAPLALEELRELRELRAEKAARLEEQAAAA